MSAATNGQAILDAQPKDLDLDGVRRDMQPYQARVDELLRRYPVKRAALLQMLWLVQEHYGWVPRIGIKWAAEQSAVSPVHAFGVVEFYTMYKQAPTGRYLIQVCHNVCCHIQGAEDLIGHIGERLGIAPGETTDDGLFTLVRVECLAMCGNGPGILINDEMLYGPGELNELEHDWHPGADDVDRWIERLRREAAERPEPEKVDSLGDIMLDTGGHPGVSGARATLLPADYAPAPPALKVAARRDEAGVEITWINAPECTRLVVERHAGGDAWQALGEVGPKDQRFLDEHGSAGARYRVIAWEGERAARPSVEAAAEGGAA